MAEKKVDRFQAIDGQTLLTLRELKGPARERAWFELCHQYEDRLRAAVFVIVKDREKAEDVVQETFVKAMRNLDQFREGSSVYTWLYRIAQNHALDEYRKRRRHEFHGDQMVREAVDENDPDERPEAALLRREEVERVRAGLAELSDEHREIVMFVDVEGHSYREAAEKFDIPEGTVMSRLFYARRKLQGIMEAEPVSPYVKKRKEPRSITVKTEKSAAPTPTKAPEAVPSTTDDDIEKLRAAILRDLEDTTTKKAAAEERVAAAKKKLDALSQ